MFSGAVKIDDIDDFINPSQKCVVPILYSKGQQQNDNKISTSGEASRPDLIKTRPRKVRKAAGPEASSTDPSSSRLDDSQTSLDSTAPNSSTYVISTSQQSPPESAETAQVSLYDCLACSGCVTTAETVLIQDQSIDVFVEKARNAKFSVASVSSQSVEFLARHFCLPARQCFKKLSWILKCHFGIDAVIDTSVGDALVQTETLREFIERYRQQTTKNCSLSSQLKPRQSNDHVNNSAASQSAAAIINKKQTDGVETNACSGITPSVVQSAGAPDDRSSTCDNQSLPLLTSHCPGWICYVEKTQPPAIVSAVSRLKSSQQIVGHLTKTLMVDCYNIKQFANNYCRRSLLPIYPKYTWSHTETHRSQLAIPSFNRIEASDVFHASIMPCYDKKLETVRPENRIINEWPIKSSNDDLYNNGESRHEWDSLSSTVNVTPENGDSGKVFPRIQEVDTVLATVEIFNLLEKIGIRDLKDVEEDDHYDDIMMGTSRWTYWDDRLPKIPNESILTSILRIGGEEGYRNGTEDGINGQYTDKQHNDERFVHSSSMCLCCHTIQPVFDNDASGGFLEYCFRESSRILFNVQLHDDERLQMKTVGNRDMKEICLKVDGEIRLRFILAYGFRNIQNIVKRIGGTAINPSDGRKEKNQIMDNQHNHETFNKCNQPVPIHFAEVMACPRGCRFGGGQLVPKHFDKFSTKSFEDSSLFNNPDSINSIVHSDSIILFAHQHPLLTLIYRYLLYFESHCSSRLSNDFSLPTTLAQYRSLIDIQPGFIGVNAFRW